MTTNETPDDKEPKQNGETGSDPATSSAHDPLGPILESFLERYRKGERPALTEYVARHPALADQIRELLPALVEIERLGVVPDDAGASPAAAESTLDQVIEGDDSEHGLSAFLAVKAGRLPRRLGDYRILGLIGDGGMGVVYEAVRESLKSRVALKVMHPRFHAKGDYHRRFHNEARSAAQLHHTNIVSVFDYGEHEGVCYYAMQYIAGHSLEEILVDVRRLRSHHGGESESYASPDAKVLATHEAAHGDPRFQARGDPLRRTVAHGLLTGCFADGAKQDPDEIPLAVTEPLEPERIPGADGNGRPELEAGPENEPAQPRKSKRDRKPSDSALGSSTSSLTGHGEDRYNREIARLGAQVADALAYAHKHGVLHRDIKPSNLLLDAVGNVWVTDFGLAKFEEAENLSHSRDVIGTLRYMAPERFRGVSSRRCDVYSLGASLYEMLTLRPVFENEDRLLLIDQIAYERPTPPRQIDSRIPRDLETIVLKALAKEPKDRFASADEMAAELRRFLEHRPIRSRPIPIHERLMRLCRRNPAVAALTGLAVFLTVFMAVGATLAAWRFREQRDLVRTQRNVALGSLNRAERAEHESQLALGRSLVHEGAALVRSGLMGQRFDSLDRLAQAAKVLGADPEGRKRLPEIRNRAIAALGLTDLRIRRRHDCGDVLGISVDAALERYAVAETSGEIVVRALHDDRELLRLPGPDRSVFWWAHPLFSLDGELLVALYAQRGERGDLFRIWRLDRRDLLGSFVSAGGVIFHPDGRRILFASMEGDVAVWDRVERRVVRRLSLDFAPYGLQLDPTGRRLAVNNSDPIHPRVVILEFDTGRVLENWRSDVGVGPMAWSADGRLLAVGDGRDPRVYVWNVSRRTLSSVLRGHITRIEAASFAHSGYLLATAGDATTRLWDAASGELLAVAPGRLRSAFAPDDRRLVLENGRRIDVVDLAPAAECRTLHPGMFGNRTETLENSGVIEADASPDGRMIATSDDGGVRLWETDTGRELARLKSGYTETLMFHPDGQCLITSSQWGLYRWPIRSDPDHGTGAIRVGPPELLRETADPRVGFATWMPDRRSLALIDNANARVLLVDSSHPHPALSRAKALDSGENHRMTSVAVSPDGRWLAVGGWYENGVRVWDLRHRQLERILKPKDAVGIAKFYIGFSPNGHWLISFTFPDASPPSYDFWRVGTWAPGLRIEPETNAGGSRAPAFTNDGRLMALPIARDQVLLADAATGRELARLTTLQPVSPVPVAFSPDGAKLVAKTNQRTALVWDLRLIRAQLEPMGLDWEAPSIPTPPSGGGAPRSVRVIGEVVEPAARRAAERAETNRRLAANPDDVEALIHRGWLSIVRKKWREAVPDLERLLRLRPGDVDASWLLGEAYEETGELAAALETYKRLLKYQPDDRDALLEHGVLALVLDRPDQALVDFSRVLAAEPELDRARYRRAQALIRLGRHREALVDLDVLMAKHPEQYGLYVLRGAAREALGELAQARVDQEKANSMLPNDPEPINGRAWLDATGPIHQRDHERAVALARRAVALAPSDQMSLNTLGVALYRIGQYAESIAVLEQSHAAGKGKFEAFDLFFLAMAHQRLGHAAQARTCFDQAVRWLAEQKNLAAQYRLELARFRAEAENLLPQAAAELPANVFAPR